MTNIQYNLQFEKLCDTLNLGKILNKPKAIQGGLLHRMFYIETIQGKYAIKALNPKIMLRATAMQNYINAEQISNLVSKNIPSLPAKKFNGIFMQEIENQFYLIFDWVDGKSFKSDEVTNIHCEKIGDILADIHMTDLSELKISNDYSDNLQLIDWNYYMQKGQENNLEWVNQLHENINMLYDWNEQGNNSAKMLSSDMVISHRDLDPKNVMWIKDNPIIIDWESAGYVNPMHELVETAIYWSEDENGIISKTKFLAFINGYKKKYGTLHVNWIFVLLNGFLGKLGWLEYNLKRSLWIECTDNEEQQIGTTHVIETIKAITRYANNILELEKWLIKEI